MYLKIDARGGEYDFYVRDPAGSSGSRSAKDADGTILSTKTAGGFVGTMLGMYAYTDGTTAVSRGPAPPARGADK